MKLLHNQLSLMVAVAMLALPAHANKAQTPVYPTTKVHQDNLDYFLHGEYGRPSSHVSFGGVIDTSTPARPDDGVDAYAGEKIVDKYRWLEDVDVISPEYAKETTADRERNLIGTRLEDDAPDGQLKNRSRLALQTVNEQKSSEVNDWVEAQNTTTLGYLKSIPYYDELRSRIDSLMDRRHQIRKISIDEMGEFELFRDTDGHNKLIYTDLDGKERLLLNEKELSADGLSSIADGDFYVSEKGSYVSYFVRTGNADTDKYSLHIMDVKTGKPASRPIAPISSNHLEMLWVDDKTLYYVGADSLGWTDVYKHVVGQKRMNDEIVVSRSHLDSGTSVTGFGFKDEDEEGRWLIVDAWRRDDTFYIKDLKTEKIYRLHSQALWDKFYKNADVFTKAVLAKYVDFDLNSKDVLLISGENTLKGEIIRTNLHNLKKREVVVSTHHFAYDELLEAVYHPEGDGYFLIAYLKDGVNQVIVTDKAGKPLARLTPSVGMASDLISYIPKPKKEGDKEQDKDDEPDEPYVSFRYQSTTMPRTVYKYSPTKGQFVDVRRRDLYPFDHTAYETKQVNYPSKDGTMVSLIISHKKGLKLDGKNPTVLYGYGGFGVVTDSAFRWDRALWLENGGVWATAHLRGDNTLGDDWHNQGKLLNKMKTFEDFDSAADYLVKEGYTSKDFLSISGASNGGLLVGATMTLHPDKYRVAIPEVGVLDMLRHADNYHTGYWVDEYGSPFDSKAQYKVLRSYSPYHNVKAGTCYPSTLVMTSKRDDRVTPSHSYKFTAELQSKQGCANPTLMYAAQTQGHGPALWKDRKDNYQIVTAFRLHEMGIKALPPMPARPTADALKGKKWLDEEAKEARKKAKKLAKRQAEKAQKAQDEQSKDSSQEQK